MLINQIYRIKELFTEERLYGNLVEQNVKYRRFFSCMDKTEDNNYNSPRGSWCLKIADGGNNSYNCGRYEQLGGYKMVFHDRVKHSDQQGGEIAWKIEMKLSIDSGATADKTDTSGFSLVFTLIEGQKLEAGYQWVITGTFRCTPNGNLEFNVSDIDETACVDELKRGTTNLDKINVTSNIDDIGEQTYSGKEFQKLIEKIMSSYDEMNGTLETIIGGWTPNGNCKNILGF